MSVSIIFGTNDKPAASQELGAQMVQSQCLTGTLFIGYPIVNTPDGPHHVDALFVSPMCGVVVFDLVEGRQLGHYAARQDYSANAIEVRLRMDRRLVHRRKLLVPIHAITFAPATSGNANTPGTEYPLINRSGLLDAIGHCDWTSQEDKTSIYRTTLSALENVATVRRSRTKREVTKTDSRGARLKKIEESIATLDTGQARAVIETVNGVQRIRGLAGSGKTIVLALKAAYLHAQHPDWRIAVTFHTRALKGHFRRLITTFAISQTGEEPNWDKLRVVSSWGAPGDPDRDGIYFEFCRNHALEYYDYQTAKANFRKPVFGAVCQRAIDEVQANEEKQALYDAILVDEAQDLPAAFLQVCYSLLPATSRRLTYAYDELQNLGSEAVPAPEKLFGSDRNGKPRVQFSSVGRDAQAQDVILAKCYRNSRPVLVAAHALGFGVYRSPSEQGEPGLVQMFENAQLWEDIGYRVKKGVLRDGARVGLYRSEDTSPRFLEEHSPVDDLLHFVRVETRDKQADWVAKQIQRNLERDDLRYEDIIVINPDPITTRKEVGLVRMRLLERGISSHIAGVDTSTDVFFKENGKSITFTGVHRAKGNEAAMVYVMNAQDCYGGARYAAGFRNRLFVAITRSKGWVRVVGLGERMEHLQKEYKRLKERDFVLDFVYPTAEQRKHMHIVHRDMTRAEQQRTAARGKDVDRLADDLEKGHVHLSDLDAESVRRLRSLLNG